MAAPAVDAVGGRFFAIGPDAALPEPHAHASDRLTFSSRLPTEIAGEAYGSRCNDPAVVWRAIEESRRLIVPQSGISGLPEASSTSGRAWPPHPRQLEGQVASRGSVDGLACRFLK